MNPIERSPNLQPLFQRMEKQKCAALALVKESLEYTNNDVYIIQLLMFAALNRTINILDAISDAIMKWNIIAAGSLLRNLLDTLAVLVFLSKQPNLNLTEVIDTLFKNGRLMKRKGMRLMRIPDADVIKCVNEVYPWAKQVYDETSGFVHFSGKHLFGIAREFLNTDKVITMGIGIGNESWPEEELKNFLEATNEITIQIYRNVEAFSRTIKR